MIWPRSFSPQRKLVRKFGEDLDSVCLTYIQEERDGKVARPRGAEDMTLGTHAKALWRDGKEAGWLTR